MYEKGIKEAQAEALRLLSEPYELPKTRSKGKKLTPKEKGAIQLELLRQATILGRHDINCDWFTFLDESEEGEVDSEDETPGFKPFPEPVIQLERLNINEIKQEKKPTMKEEVKPPTKPSAPQEKTKVTERIIFNAFNLNWKRIETRRFWEFKSSQDIYRACQQRALANVELGSMISEHYDKLDSLMESNKKGQDDLIRLIDMVRIETEVIQKECTKMVDKMASDMTSVGNTTITIAEKSEKMKTDLMKALYESFTARNNDLREIRQQKAFLNRLVELNVDNLYEDLDPGQEEMIAHLSKAGTAKVAGASAKASHTTSSRLSPKASGSTTTKSTIPMTTKSAIKKPTGAGTLREKHRMLLDQLAEYYSKR